MIKPDFNEWVSRRNNDITEGIWDWLTGGGKKNKPTPPPEWSPDEPEEINRMIYENPIVQRYTDVILKHLGIGVGATVQPLSTSGEPAGPSIVIRNWSTESPEFIEALQRFIAGHILGKGKQKSFLRISHHDAIVIIHMLDRLSAGKSKNSIADDLHITTPADLSSWLQTKVPVAPDAKLQLGYNAANSEFAGLRYRRTGRGVPTSDPKIRELTNAANAVVAYKKTRPSPQSRILTPLWNALEKLNTALYAVLGKEVEAAKIEPRGGKKAAKETPIVPTKETPEEDEGAAKSTKKKPGDGMLPFPD